MSNARTHKSDERNRIKQHEPPQRRRLSSALLSTVDLGLAGALFVVPFLMGGRLAIGQMGLVITTLWAATAWAVYAAIEGRQRCIGTRAYWILLAAGILVAFQFIELPSSWIQSLSRETLRILPLWVSTGAGSLGEWSHISLIPAETRSGFVTFLAYVLLFVVALHRIQRPQDVERFLRWVAFAAIIMALFGLVQYLTSNGKFFWFFEYPSTNTRSVPKGSFSNRNHFAQFLALGAAPLICYLLTRLRRHSAAMGQRFQQVAQRRLGMPDLSVGLLVLALGIVAFTLLLSLSRGGTVALLVATSVCLLCLYVKNEVSGKLLTAVVAVGTLIGGFLMIYGYDMVDKRLSEWQPKGRLEIWNANLSTISHFPLLGTGVGSHKYAYPMYLDAPFDGHEYTHAENSYMQVASETGLLGLSLAIVAVGTCLFWCVRGLQLSQHSGSTLALAAVLGSLAADAVHAGCDFIWYVPGVMVMVILLAACACRTYQLISGRTAVKELPGAATIRLVPRWACLLAVIGLCLLGNWMIEVKRPAFAAESDWLEYRRLAIHAPNSQTEDELFRYKIDHLISAAKANPDDARIQLLLADKYRVLFERIQQNGDNAMPVSQIRDAAIASQFPSQQALNEWLVRAFGDSVPLLRAAHHFARRAVTLCPLQGQAYVCLADLDFVGNPKGVARDAYYRQALLLRPYDPFVLFSAGREALLASDLEKALGYWRGAFHRDNKYRLEIIDLLAGQLPPKLIIDRLKPDWASLRLMKQHYKRLNRPDEYRVVLECHARSSIQRARESEGKTALTAWIEAQDSFDQMKMPDQALKCLTEAVRSAPSSYQARHALAIWLYSHDRAAEAAEHLTWCARFRPRDAVLQDLAANAMKAKLRAANTSRLTVQPRVQTTR